MGGFASMIRFGRDQADVLRVEYISTSVYNTSIDSLVSFRESSQDVEDLLSSIRHNLEVGLADIRRIETERARPCW